MFIFFKSQHFIPKIYTSVIEEIERFENFPDEKIIISKNNVSEKKFLSLMPFCEPMLSKRNLYPTNGGTIKQKKFDVKMIHSDRTYQKIKEKQITGKYLDAIRWILFYSDGKFSLKDIAKKTNISYDELILVANELCNQNLLKTLDVKKE